MKNNFIFSRVVLLSLIVLSLQSCAVKWVADYRKDVEDEIVSVAKKVDMYYADLGSVTAEDNTLQFTSELTKESFLKRYREIESDLYGLFLKNQARPLNTEATEITQSILEKFWRKYNGDVGTSKALLQTHRGRFSRNFKALLTAEKVLENPD